MKATHKGAHDYERVSHLSCTAQKRSQSWVFVFFFPISKNFFLTFQEAFSVLMISAADFYFWVI